MNRTEDKIFEDRVGRLMLRLSLPAITGMIIYSLFGLIDTFFVAKLGTGALAAITLCIPIEILLVSVGSATGVGITSLLSRTLGMREYKRADNIAWHGLIICVIYGVLFSCLGVANIDGLLRMFGCTAELYSMCRQYLYIILMGSLFTFIPMICGNILQGEGNASLPILLAVVGIMFNVILDPVLIFGLGPLPPMGLSGAAWADIIALAFCSLISLQTMYRSRVYLSWSWHHFRPDLRVLFGIYKVGLPALLMELLSVALLVLFNKILLGFGSVAVAVMGIFSRIRSLIYMPVYGLTQGAMPIIGFAYGAGDHERVKEAIIKASVVSFIFVLVGWLAMQANSEWLMSRFTSDRELILAGISCLRLATLCLPVMGPIIILGSVLQSVDRGVSAMALSIIRQIGFFLPAIFILSYYLGINGVWLAFSISELLSAILALLYFTRLWHSLQPKPAQHRKVVFFTSGYVLGRISAWMKW